MAPATRLGLLYASSFAVLGSVVPYFVLEMQDRGIRGTALIVLMAALPLGRLVAGPFWGVVADRFRASGKVLFWAALASALGCTAFIWAPGGWVLFWMLLYAAGRGPLTPVLDGMALVHLGDDKLRYGKIRRWGSVGYMVATLVAAGLRDLIGLSPLAVGAVLSWALAGLALGERRAPAIPRAPVLPVLVVFLRDRRIRWLLASGVLHFIGHIGLSGFLAVHMKTLGAPATWAGAAIALGVAVEVVLMTWAKPVFERVGVRGLYLLAVGSAVPRWWLTGVVEDPVLLVLIQSVHGITFGGFWLAGVAMIADRAPPEIVTSSQATFSAAIGGLGALLGLVWGTWMVESFSTTALFQANALIAAVAFFVAIPATWRYGQSAPIRRDP